MLIDLEKWLARVYKNTPKLSPDSKSSIISIWPWVALVFGVVQLLAALALWHWGHDVTSLVHSLNTYYPTNFSSHINGLNIFYWISLVVLVIDGLILLLAFPKLRLQAKSGWNFLFYGALLNLVYGVFSAFNNYGGFSSLARQIIVTGVILYFLFQIRDHYKA